MDMANNIFKMEIITMVIISIINFKERGHTHGLVELIILVSLRVEKEMGKEFGDLVIKQIVIFMKESIYKIGNMAKEYINGRMELFIKALLRMI